ncbi:hypothetical protein GVX82_05025 [Patescibacteria group bacterium]|jgi:hypothetical protein|nr:hypothetical protein [Patescibacteria group bacterium]
MSNDTKRDDERTDQTIEEHTADEPQEASSHATDQDTTTSDEAEPVVPTEGQDAPRAEDTNAEEGSATTAAAQPADPADTTGDAAKEEVLSGETSVATEPSAGEPAPTQSGARWGQVALVLAGLAVVTGLTVTGVMNLDPSDGTQESASTASSEVIARVNGEPITQGEFDQQMQQAESFISSMGDADPAQVEQVRAQLEDSIVDDLINAELLYQEAVAQGFEAGPEAVEGEVQATQEQMGSAEQFSAQLATLGLTEEGFRDLIARQVTIDDYLSAEAGIDEIEVTEEEVQTFYDDAVANFEGEPPSLEEARPQIEQQLINEKSQEIVQALIEELRSEAEVEVLL